MPDETGSDLVSDGPPRFCVDERMLHAVSGGPALRKVEDRNGSSRDGQRQQARHRATAEGRRSSSVAVDDHVACLPRGSFGCCRIRRHEHVGEFIWCDYFDAPLLEIVPPARGIAGDRYAAWDPSEREERVRAMLQRAQGSDS